MLSIGMAFFKFLLLLYFAFLNNELYVKCDEELEFFKGIDSIVNDPNLYDKRISPAGHDEATEIHIFLRVLDLWGLDQKIMECKMDTYFFMFWEDPRFRTNSTNSTKYHTFSITTEETVRKFWIPKIVFPNVKTASFHNVPQKNHLLMIDTDGYLMYVFRVILSISCPMKFHHYPFDEQSCTLQISSMVSEESDIKWIPGDKYDAVELSQKIHLPQFNLVDVDIPKCEEAFTLENRSGCIQVRFDFERRIGFHLINTFIPSGLLVVISWTSFWMDPGAVPGRVTLGVTNLLAISTKASALLTATVEVSYIKAIDVWMMVCIAFIFLSMCEFVAAYYVWYKKTKMPTNSSDVIDESHKTKTGRFRNFFRTLTIDGWARMIFPSTFIIFNVIYWLTYL